MEDKNSEMNNQKMDDASMNNGQGVADASGKAIKKGLTTRGILLIGIGGLLLVLLIVGAAAWYTRISVVNQISVDAAKFDFKANYTSDNFIIRAEDYTNVYGENKAAPGTAGVIPILVSAGDSNVDVNYILSLNTSGMDEAFKKRIRFFYIPFDKKDLAFQDGVYDPSYEKEFDSANTIKGTLKGSANGTGENHYEYIYWEWVYDLNPYRFYDPDAKQWQISTDPSAPNTARFGELYPKADESIAKFDELDTQIGLGKCDDTFKSPDSGKTYATASETTYKVNQDGTYEEVPGIVKAYQTAMECVLDITGAMATPTYDATVRDRRQLPTTGTYGSAFIDLGSVINAHNSVYPTAVN